MERLEKFPRSPGPGLGTDPPRSSEGNEPGIAQLDFAGDIDKPANAIPNVIARLIETETWRNSATVVVAVLLVGLGLWAYNGVKGAIADARVSGLAALIDTVAKGLDVWVDEHRFDLQARARDADVVAPVVALDAASRRRQDAATLCASADGAALGQALGPTLEARGLVAYMLLDRAGLVLATDDPRRCGQQMRAVALRKRVDEAFEGKAGFVRPVADLQLTLPPADARPRTLAWLVVPVRGDGAVVAGALAFGVAADPELTTIFSAARPGETAEVYAFSEDGLMLSESRFADDLGRWGLVGGNDSPSSVFRVRVRDPGGDLGAGHAPAIEPDARPLIRPAALALAARGRPEGERHGVVGEPYRSYHGQESIGAWRWLPAYDMGIIAEIRAAEAFAPLRSLLLAFSVIGGFVALSLAAAAFSSLSLTQLQRHFGKLERLGAYTLERQIDEGGMANVFAARHALLKRRTAVKILKKHVATDEFVARFEREVQLASQLRHPNTVQIYDYGRTREGEPYYVMEYLDGLTLAELVADSGAIPAARVVHILRQICAALREAHELGIVHRDVKPENIMLCQRGEDDFVKLLDYGLVKDLSRPETRDLTKQLRVLGTPRYMAPERLIDPGDVDARSDLYSVGAVGYLLLTGKPVFGAETDADVSRQVMHAPPQRASEHAPSGVPRELDDLILACLQKDRAHRPRSAEEMGEALARLALRHPWSQRDARAWWQGYRARQKEAAALKKAEEKDKAMASRRAAERRRA